MKVMAPLGSSRSMQAPLRWVTANPPRRVGSDSQGMLHHERRQLGNVQSLVPKQACQRNRPGITVPPLAVFESRPRRRYRGSRPDGRWWRASEARDGDLVAETPSMATKSTAAVE